MKGLLDILFDLTGEIENDHHFIVSQIWPHPQHLADYN